MIDIVRTIKAMFHTERINETESFSDFDSHFTIKGDQFPDQNCIMGLSGCVDNSDVIQITIDQEQCLCYNQGTGVWEGDYEQFLSSVVPDINYEVQIHIRKKSTGRIVLYCWHCIESFIETINKIDFLDWLSKRYTRFGVIEFVIYDQTDIFLQGCYLSVHSSEKEWKQENVKSIAEEDALIQAVQSIGSFLDRNKYRLLPEFFDFESYVNADLLMDLFSIFRNVLSFAYLANCSYFKDDKIVIQISPDRTPQEYTLEELGYNAGIFEVYKWVFSGNHQIDKAIVARNVFSQVCKNRIGDIDSEIVSTIRNNYEISLKGDVERYIEAREKVSDYVVEISNRVHEITKEIGAGLKTNFIGAMGFLISLILTDSVDIEKWMESKAPQNVILVCRLFVAITTIYLIVTIIDEVWKWNNLRKEFVAYQQSLDGLITKQEFETVLGKDKELKCSRKNLICLSLVLYSLWGLLILISVVFIIQLSQ